jgi:capsular exopolysaccharide synthesis family protein
MSHIFDALRRSEAESGGVDLAALPSATVLLQRAERRATSQWEAAVLSEQLDPSNAAEPGTQLTPIGQPAAKDLDNAPVQLSQPEERFDPFGQFKSLPVALDPQSRLLCVTENGSPAAEAFRLLGVRLRDLRRQRSLKILLITSTIPEEGKSLVSANLACTLALGTHERILLLEGDLRRPSLSQKFGLRRNPGLCECLKGERSLATSIYQLEGLNLWILPAGSTPSNAQELLQSGRLSSLMDELAVWFDFIIIDSPPVLPLADTSVWMRLANGILLVTRQGTTQKRALLKGIEALEHKKLIGALVNSSTGASEEDYYYYRGAPTASRPTDGPAV